jgi:hypothetical protein
VVTVATGASTAYTASGNSGDLTVGSLTRLAIDFNVTAVAGTVPSCTFSVERKGSDGVYYVIAASAAVSAVGATSFSVGAGLTTSSAFGATIRLKWAISGTAPSFTFTYSAVGK